MTLTIPALIGGHRLAAEKQEPQPRELQGFKSALASKKPLNTTDYALLVTVPAGDNQVTYRRSHVYPALKPVSLKKPTTQANFDLLWASMPMPRYMDKAYTRTFMVNNKEAGMRRSYGYRMDGLTAKKEA